MERKSLGNNQRLPVLCDKDRPSRLKRASLQLHKTFPAGKNVFAFLHHLRQIDIVPEDFSIVHLAKKIVVAAAKVHHRALAMCPDKIPCGLFNQNCGRDHVFMHKKIVIPFSVQTKLLRKGNGLGIVQATFFPPRF